jgi:hypothetical protein
MEILQLISEGITSNQIGGGGSALRGKGVVS